MTRLESAFAALKFKGIHLVFNSSSVAFNGAAGLQTAF